jgi:hypothetical protein
MRTWFAIFQPCVGSPTMFSVGTCTSVKKTWQKSWSPVICLRGEISIPGDLMSMRRKPIPACFFTSGSVRTRQKIQSPCRPLEVQIFCPFTTYSPSTSSARV